MNECLNEWMISGMNEMMIKRKENRTMNRISDMYGKLCHDGRINERLNWRIDS